MPHSNSLRHSTLRSLLWLLAALSVASVAGAMTYVMPTDDELVQRADLVVAGRISSVAAAPGLERPATDYLVELERTFKGFALGGAVLVRVPGGRREDGVASLVWGAPAFRPGDRVLLFLAPESDGAYGILHLGLGAFRRLDLTDRSVYVRDLGQAHDLDLPGDTRAAQRRVSHLPRDAEAFERWLTELELGPPPPADYFVTEPSLRLQQRFTLTQATPCGEAAQRGIRWIEFDRGENVTILAHQGGEPSLAGGGFDQLQTGLEVWNDDPATPVDLVYGGTTTATAGHSGSDGLNVFLPNDPNDDIEGTFDGSGILASTIIWFDCAITHDWRGETFHRLFEADIITESGLSNFFAQRDDDLQSYAQLAAHEVGHALGIGHSCGDSASGSCSGNTRADEALMRAQVHSEPRGAELRGDDFDALTFLYGSTSTTGLPIAPSNLVATSFSASEIRLVWNDNSTDELAFHVEMSSGGGFTEILTLLADSETATITGLPDGAQRTFRVRARNDQGFSGYSNQATATTGSVSECTADDFTLCLNGNRFRVTAQFETPGGEAGAARAEGLTADTGFFWFFLDTNIELVLKVLESCGGSGNGHYWVFAGGLTNLEVEITVVDTATGMTQRYRNAQGAAFQPILDTAAFPSCP